VDQKEPLLARPATGQEPFPCFLGPSLSLYDPYPWSFPASPFGTPLLFVLTHPLGAQQGFQFHPELSWMPAVFPALPRLRPRREMAHYEPVHPHFFRRPPSFCRSPQVSSSPLPHFSLPPLRLSTDCHPSVLIHSVLTSRLVFFSCICLPSSPPIYQVMPLFIPSLCFQNLTSNFVGNSPLLLGPFDLCLAHFLS